VRVASWIAVVLGALVALGGVSRADEPPKKKAGLFDFETWKTPARRQRDAARTLAPGQLDLEPLGRFDEPPRTLRVRVYADRDYRGGVLRWQTKVRGEIDRVNHVVEPVFNVHFEIESLREWDRAHVGVPLDALLGELDALDGARDVDWVVGFVTPFRGVAASIHQIGMARLSSRAFVLRAMDDDEEGRALEREFTMLSADEREKLYADRKEHKELVMFLHEWAHSMGALHVGESTVIMNPLYDPKQAAFSDFEKRLIGLVLDARTRDRTRPYPESAALASLIEAGPRDEGSDKDRAALLQVLRARGDGSAPRATAPVAPGTPAAPKTGAPTNVAARATIDRALARVRADDLAGATPLIFEAAKEAEAGPPDAPTLLRIAEAAGAVGALTTGEAALARAGQGAAHAGELAAALEAERARAALPREAVALGIRPEDEPRYVAAFWTASRAVGSRNYVAAAHELAELGEAFPDSAGRDVVACELALATKRFDEAQRRCEAALAKCPSAVRAHVALGRVLVHARRNFDAEKHFRRVILLDPTDDTAWSELGHLYRATGAETQRQQLAREHEALFSTPLPDRDEVSARR
jgi:tetratricopeptide (TPR) repeat protein